MVYLAIYTRLIDWHISHYKLTVTLRSVLGVIATRVLYAPTVSRGTLDQALVIPLGLLFGCECSVCLLLIHILYRHYTEMQ